MVRSTGSSGDVTGRSSTAMFTYGTGTLPSAIATSSVRSSHDPGPHAKARTTSAWLNTNARSTESSIGSRAPHPVTTSSAIRSTPEPAVPADQSAGAAVVVQLALRTGQRRDDGRGQLLPELDDPLVERVDVPDRALREDLVLVHRDQLAERVRRQPIQQHRVGRAVAGEGAVGHLLRGNAFRFDLVRRLAERERFGLRQQVGRQQILVVAELVVGVHETDEVARDQLRALVDELVERVLSVGARLSPHDRAGLHGDGTAVEVDRLAVALHAQLLEVRGEASEVLAVRQDGLRLGFEEIVVPEADQTQQRREVRLDRRGAEVLVDR